MFNKVIKRFVLGKIFCIFGKSASGKDTLYQELISDKELNLKQVVLYTTRPMRIDETHGNNYFFVSEAEMNNLSEQGKIIEHRVYETVFGPWHYFMADDGNINLNENNYLTIGTLESYCSIRNYFGTDKVIPLYIHVEDGERLMRSLNRERIQSKPAYDEMCRRFLADCQDFSDEKLEAAGIIDCYENVDFEECLSELKDSINRNCD